jgi:hypothetical protein
MSWPPASLEEPVACTGIEAGRPDGFDFVVI